MKTTHINPTLAFLLVSSLTWSAYAQQAKAPVAPTLPAASPTVASAPAAIAKQQAAMPVVEPAQAPIAVPAPKGEKVESTPTLKYRDPSKPLTIGEMSDIQAADETEKFLKKHGFTSKKPEVAKGGGTAKGDVKPAKPLPPLNTLKLVGVYGVPGKLRADLLLNGTLFPIERPTGVGKATVRGVDASGVDVLLPSSQSKGVKCPKKSPADCKAPERVHHLRVGDAVEWR